MPSPVVRARDFLSLPSSSTAAQQAAGRADDDPSTAVPPTLRLTPRLHARVANNTNTAVATPTSILNAHPIPLERVSSPPLFAEQFAGSPFAYKRSAGRAARRFSLGPAATALDDVPEAPPFPSGSSDAGFFDLQTGDLFRGAQIHPGIDDGFSTQYKQSKLAAAANKDDDSADGTVTEASDSDSDSSSSSSSSGSGLELGRRMGEAIDRVGDVLGVGRRGSTTSTISLSTVNTKSTNPNGPQLRGRRRSRATLRGTFSLGTRRTASPDSTATTRRVRLPKRREFCLMLPLQSATALDEADVTDAGIGLGPGPLDIDLENLPPQVPRVAFTDQQPSLHGRLITTSTLPSILDKIRTERIRTGYNDPAEVEARAQKLARDIEADKRLNRKVHHRSRAGRKQAKRERRHRLQELGLTGGLLRPKSAADVLGLADRAATPASGSTTRSKGCWWLDVSCPGWEDLRDIGESLHIHPLTLEDILQQDPREKIDVFENLGYYLVVFRAVDETYFKYTPALAGEGSGAAGKAGSGSGAGGKAKLEIVEDRPGKEGLEGLAAGGLNVYLVVFKDGIISFHFDDLSKHVDRVRDRILQLQKDTASAEWIAHGLMDSIVDAFFPLIKHVDTEIDQIDSLVTDPSTEPERKATPPSQAPTLDQLTYEMDDLDEKGRRRNGSRRLTTASAPAPLSVRWRRTVATLRLQRDKLSTVFPAFPNTDRPILSPSTRRKLQNFGKFMGVYGRHKDPAVFANPVYDRTDMLKRMTDVRRIVTGLSRLLSAKFQVMARLKKRADKGDAEVIAYIGDVQDHIMMLQSSLSHYEYILSHCQPAYMSHLGVTSTVARGSTDELILALSCVTIGILPMQVLVGLFSMNLRIPQNGDPTDRAYHKEPDGSQSPFNFFYSIVGGVVLIGIGIWVLVRFWRWQAKVKWGRINALRTAQLQARAGKLQEDIRRGKQ